MPRNNTSEFVFLVSDAEFGGKHIFMANLGNALVEIGKTLTFVVQSGGKLETYLNADYVPGASVSSIDFSEESTTVTEARHCLTHVSPGAKVFATGRHDAKVLELVKPHFDHLRWSAFRHSGFPLKAGSLARRYYDSCALIALTSQRLMNTEFAHIPAHRKVLVRSTVPAKWANAVREARERQPVWTQSDIRRMRIVYVGRLSWEKGVDRLIKAVADQFHSCDRLELRVCGSGPEEADLWNLATELGVSSRVTFYPFRRDVSEYYAMADCVALPSVAGETGPLSLKEAMAAGICVIATRVGGIEEIVDDGLNGLLVSPDEPLVGVLVKLAEDLPFRERLASAALEAAQSFGSWTDAARTLAEHDGLRT